MSGFLTWCKRHPSLIIGAGLMLASSGLDGVYMTLWMPRSVWWLGLVLNTMADATDLYLSQRMGGLMRSKDEAKRWGALFLLVASQVIAIFYSWYFGYLQLRRVLPAIEAHDAERVALIAAGFIPLLLAILGLVDGLSSFSSKRFFAESEPEVAAPKPEPFKCPICGATSGKSGKPFRSQAAVSGHMSEHKGAERGDH